jgi:olefin beta-lactone synthetase
LSPSFNIADKLHAAANAWPDVPCLIEGMLPSNESLTFGELAGSAARGAAWLQAHNVQPGDTVLVCVPISIALYEALLSVFWSGAAVVIPGPAISRASIAHACRITKPKLIIAPTRFYLYTLGLPDIRAVPTWARSSCFPFPGTTPWLGGAASLKPIPTPAHRNADDHALITFTSGSTGAPKATARSHALMLAQGAAVAHSLDLKPGQVDLATMPVVALANIGEGVTSVIPLADVRKPAKADPALLARQITLRKVTRTVASPALLENLTAHLLKTNQTLPSLKTIHSGGAPVFPRLLNRLRKTCPNADLYAVYGSTEAEPIASLPWRENATSDHAQSAAGAGLPAGHPEPCVTLRIVNFPPGKPNPPGPFTAEQFAALSAGPNQPGEIVVTGDHVVKGYLNPADNAHTKFHVNAQTWHRTGDAGYLDADGRLWLLGRHSETVTLEGKTFHPFAIEAAVSSLSDHFVRSAFLAYNNLPTLVIQVDPAVADYGDAMSLLMRSLPTWHIAQFTIVTAIPVDARHNAKVDYPALRALLKRQTLQFVRFQGPATSFTTSHQHKTP